LENLLELGPFH